VNWSAFIVWGRFEILAYVKCSEEGGCSVVLNADNFEYFIIDLFSNIKQFMVQ
jgi:hypothetical protein